MIRFTGFSGLLASCLLLANAAFADDAKLVQAVRTTPDIKFKTEQGNIIHLNPQNTKLTAVHFWATWCVPCVAEMAQVDATQWAYGEDKMKIVAISLDGDDSMEMVKQFYADHKITHIKPYLDPGMASFKAIDGKGVPTTLFIDHDGNEIARVEGPLDWNARDITRFFDAHAK